MKAVVVFSISRRLGGKSRAPAALMFMIIINLSGLGTCPIRRVTPANAPLGEAVPESSLQSRCGAGDPLGAVAQARFGPGEDRLDDRRVGLLRRARRKRRLRVVLDAELDRF